MDIRMCIRSLTLIIAAVLALESCTSAQSTSATATGTSAVQRSALRPVVLRYFHRTLRCSTCLSVERITRTVLSEQYTGDSTVTLEVYNVDEPVNAHFIKEYNLSGSTLLICAGGTCDDLTEAAFDHALGEVGKLQDLLITTIEARRRVPPAP